MFYYFNNKRASSRICFRFVNHSFDFSPDIFANTKYFQRNRSSLRRGARAPQL